MTTSEAPQVISTRDGAVSTIVLNAPERKNALD